MTTSTTLLKAIGADADSPRWTEFVARYKPVMESFLSREFPSVSADDVMQETLLVLVRKLPDYRYAPDEKGHFKSWLLGILKNKAREELKRQGRVSRAEDAAKDVAALEPSVAASDADGADGDGRIAAYEAALQQLLANPKLSERTRQIFIRTALKGVIPAGLLRMKKWAMRLAMAVGAFFTALLLLLPFADAEHGYASFSSSARLVIFFWFVPRSVTLMLLISTRVRLLFNR